MNLIPIIQSHRPFVIAGPCSAETQEQLIETAVQIAKNKAVHGLRAGVWKPRTRPDSFEGVGEEALPWLVEAGRITGLPTTTEVANKQHVEKALKAGIDILWIGARTTVNPFAVQEIADALKDVSIPVMIKNPVNPDVELWLGAFERLEKAGIKELVAIHRGFSVYNHEKYRNEPSWEIPIALKERLPDLPMLCDPSHIAGKRDLIFEISQKAMDLNFNGLMIETHLNPEMAWSDAQQQVTVGQLTTILSNLVLRSKDIQGDIAGDLDKLRTMTAALDERIFSLLVERMKVSEEVGIFKRENNITILQQEHWAKMIANRLKNANEQELSATFIRQFMDAIHQESIRHQEKVMNK
ncbi:MAG: bifunctional 3-deoxy-7-phosphoheptulonate synthase/chorismate mutase type II [Crocinitomicaceae bacterium]|nr:bifunctional 3-deoxy-7-phosphoheptulonate synthase/chorismate mutase type II [Crocinitomicaceae bacterium]